MPGTVRNVLSLVPHRSTPLFYTYIRSYALLRAVSAFAMLQTFGIPPRGSRSATLRGCFLMFGARKMTANAHASMEFAVAFLAASYIFAKKPLYWT